MGVIIIEGGLGYLMLDAPLKNVRKRKSKKLQNANIRLLALKEILYAYTYMFHQ